MEHVNNKKTCDGVNLHDLRSEADGIAMERGDGETLVAHAILALISRRSSYPLLQQEGLELEVLVTQAEDNINMNTQYCSLSDAHRRYAKTIQKNSLNRVFDEVKRTRHDHNDKLIDVKSFLITLGEQTLISTVSLSDKTFGVKSPCPLLSTNGHVVPRTIAAANFEYLAPRSTAILFTSDEADIYANKVTKDCFIFHGKPIAYNFTQAILYRDSKRLAFIAKSGHKVDLGFAIQSIVFPHLAEAKEISIIQTCDFLDPELSQITSDAHIAKPFLETLKSVSGPRGQFVRTPIDGAVVSLCII